MSRLSFVVPSNYKFVFLDLIVSTRNINYRCLEGCDKFVSDAIVLIVYSFLLQICQHYAGNCIFI